MAPRFANVFLSLAIIAQIALGAWIVSGWSGPGAPTDAEDSAALFNRLLPFVAGGAVLALVAYITTFSPHRRMRPWVGTVLLAISTGAVAGLMGRVAISGFSLIESEVPATDTLCIGLAAAGAVALVGLLLVFEFGNRALWSFAARAFDRAGWAAGSLAADRVLLLFRPGQSTALRSVALARFRKGARGSVVEELARLAESDPSDVDVLEALCRDATERGDAPARLNYLRRLHTALPDDNELRSILVGALVEAGLFREAQGHLDQLPPPETPDEIERNIRVLLALGDMHRAVDMARLLGEKEGIPFRRSQALLRDIITRTSEFVPALNLLAAQAERMAQRDQRLRWLEKSLAADPAQPAVRDELIQLYRETGNTRKLETLIEAALEQSPGDTALVMEIVELTKDAGRIEEALKRLQPILAEERAPVRALLLAAEMQHELGRNDDATATLGRLEGRSNISAAERRQIDALQRRIDESVYTTAVVEAMEAAHREPADLALQLAALQRLIDGRHSERIVAHVDFLLAHHPTAREQLIERLAQMKDLADDPVPFPVLNLLADLQAMVGRYDDALATIQRLEDRSIDKVGAAREHCQKVLRRAPHHLPTLRHLGDVYRRHGKLTEMVHAYTLYLSHEDKSSPDSAEIVLALANAYLSLRDFRSARPHVDRVLAAGPPDPAFLRRVISLALDQDQPEAAAEYFQLLDGKDTRDKELKAFKERIDIGLGQRRFAFLKGEVDAGKGGPEQLERLGDISRDIAQYHEAITYYQRASRDTSDANRARRCTAKLAWCYMKRRLDDLCEETLKGVRISLEDDQAELDTIMDIMYDIGDMMVEAKMYDKADRVFKQLCKIDAGYRDVLARVEKLRL